MFFLTRFYIPLHYPNRIHYKKTTTESSRIIRYMSNDTRRIPVRSALQCSYPQLLDFIEAHGKFYKIDLSFMKIKIKKIITWPKESKYRIHKC